MAWNEELTDLCREIKRRYGRSDMLTFADIALPRKAGEKFADTLFEAAPLRHSRQELSFYGDDTIVFDPDELVMVGAPGIRCFVWKDDLLIPDESTLKVTEHNGREYKTYDKWDETGEFTYSVCMEFRFYWARPDTKYADFVEEFSISHYDSSVSRALGDTDPGTPRVGSNLYVSAF